MDKKPKLNYASPDMEYLELQLFDLLATSTTSVKTDDWGGSEEIKW